MTVRDVIVAVLLVAGGGIEVLCCLGVLVMRDVYDRLHYVGAAAVGAVFIAIAITVQEGFSLIANKALGIALFLLLIGPVLANATSRAARIREHGHWMPHPEEDIDVEDSGP